METYPFSGSDASELPAGFLIAFFLIAGVLIKTGFVWWAAVLMLGLCLLDISCKMKLVPRRNFSRFLNKMSTLWPRSTLVTSLGLHPPYAGVANGRHAKARN